MTTVYTGPEDRDEIAFAAQELDEADEALLAALAALYAEADPMPDGLVDRIQFELTLDALHTEVATLTQLDLAGSGARGATGSSAEPEAVRTITFTAEAVTTMVTITSQRDGTVRVDGWAVPGSGLRVEVLLVGDTRQTEADDDGRFVFDDLPSGLAKFALHLSGPDGTTASVVSPTIEL